MELGHMSCNMLVDYETETQCTKENYQIQECEALKIHLNFMFYGLKTGHMNLIWIRIPQQHCLYTINDIIL